MQDFFHSLPLIFKDFEGNAPANEAVVFAAWRKIAGEALGSHAVPLRLDKKKLIVAVSSDTWRKQIEDLSGQIIFQLNSVLGTALVTFIDFRVDPKSVEKGRREKRASEFSEAEQIAIAMREVSQNLRLAAQTIADETLRKQFLLAAGSSLERNKRSG